MTKRLIAAVAGLVLMALLARRPGESGKPSLHRSPRPVEEPPALVVQPEPSAPGKAQLWSCLKEPDPIRRTAEYLGVVPVDAFVSAAQDAVAQLHRARSRRQLELSSPDPAIQISIDADASYEAERESALARLEPFLDQRERHREFREQVDTWAASVWAASQGVYERPRR